MAARAARKIETSAPESDVEKATAIVQDLARRLVEAEQEAASFAPRRAELAFAAATGDAAAVAALSALTIEEDKAKHAAGDLRDAISESRRRLKAAEAGAATAEDQARYAAALKAGERYVSKSEEIDDLATRLRQAVNERAALAEELLLSGCLPPFTALGIIDASGERLNGALRRAGVHTLYTGLPHASGHSDSPLGVVDRALVKQLQPPSKVSKMQRIL
jgi:hypothetical protein